MMTAGASPLHLHAFRGGVYSGRNKEFPRYLLFSFIFMRNAVVLLSRNMSQDKNTEIDQRGYAAVC